MKKFSILTALSLAASLFFVGSAQAGDKQEKNIVQIAAGAGQFNTLVAAAPLNASNSPVQATVSTADCGISHADVQFEAAMKHSDPKTGRRLIEAAAEAGSSKAQYFMGLTLKNSDQAKAIAWFKAAAKQGHKPAYAALHEMFGASENVRAKETQIYSSLKRSLFASRKSAIVRTERNIREALDRRAEKNLANSQATADGARHTVRANGRPRFPGTLPFDLAAQNALSIAREQAKAEFAQARTQSTAGHPADLNSVKFVSDSPAMRAYVTKHAEAARAGVVESQILMGDFHVSGQLVQENGATARAWYEKAVSSGSVNAMLKIASSHERGIGTIPNYTEAYAWYKMAAEAGNGVAMVRMSKLIQDEKVTPLVGESAYDLLKAAADRGVGREELEEMETQYNSTSLRTPGLWTGAFLNQ
jgi:TPR repeat protein